MYPVRAHIRHALTQKGASAMANIDLINTILQKYPRLTKAERKVADAVIADPQRVLTATITELAELCGVGETSVFRFCRTLDLEGYQDFKVSLALSTNAQDPLDMRSAADSLPSDNLESLTKNVYNAYLLSLNDALANIQPAAVSRAVELLLSAGSIHLFGMGTSGITAAAAQNRFLRLTPQVFFHSDTHTQITTAALLDSSCAAVIFSNSGTTKDCITLARLAKENGAVVIFVTKYAQSPAARYADVLLVSGAVEGPIPGGSIAGKVSQMFMVDGLYTEYFRRMGESAVANKQRTAAAVAEKKL